MIPTEYRCDCGHVFSAKIHEDRSVTCPACGRKRLVSVQQEEMSSTKERDSTTEAASEVMAREGSIFSGAR